MFRHRVVPVVLAVLLSACAGREPVPGPAFQLAPIALGAVGDSVMYLDRGYTLTIIARQSDTLLVETNQTAVVHVMRTAPDTLQAFYEHLLLRVTTPRETRTPETDALVGPGVRFVLHEVDGRVERVSAPALPAEILQVTDLRRQFDDFFLRTSGRPLALGEEWVDTLVMDGSEGEATAERRTVTRFRVTRDTVLLGIPARVVEYEAAIEAGLTTAPTTQGVLRSRLAGEEEGTFAYSPERKVMLARTRAGVLEGEIVVEGNLQRVRFPQLFRYRGTTELIPPAEPGAVSRRPPEPVEPTPQP